MSELHHVDVADDHFLIELLAGASIGQLGLGVFRKMSLLEVAPDFLFLDAVEDGGGEFQTEEFRGPAQVRFEHLSDVHA